MRAIKLLNLQRDADMTGRVLKLVGTPQAMPGRRPAAAE